MRIEVNGNPGEVATRTLAEVLAELGFAGGALATAVNGHFVPATRRAETVLNEGDRVEVLAPMQGG